MQLLNKLFWTFFRIGGLTFGGGYAMLPMIQQEIVEQNGWATEEEVLDYYAVGQCTPGIIAVNTATFIGYKLKGVIGGIVATLGVVAPSLVIITAIAAFIRQFAQLEIVSHAFGGIRVAVAVLIVNAILKLWKGSVTDPYTLVIFLAVLAASLLLGTSPILIVVLAALCGIVLRAKKEAAK